MFKIYSTKLGIYPESNFVGKKQNGEEKLQKTKRRSNKCKAKRGRKIAKSETEKYKCKAKQRRKSAKRIFLK